MSDWSARQLKHAGMGSGVDVGAARRSHGGAAGGREQPLALARPAEQGSGEARSPMIDRLIIPITACFYTLVVAPLVIFSYSENYKFQGDAIDTRIDNKIFWPLMAMMTVIVLFQNRERLKEFVLPRHLIFLLLYIALAGVSVLWAFQPSSSFVRLGQQLMVVGSIVLSAMLATRSADLIRGLFVCFACAAILNLAVILTFPPPVLGKYTAPGYTGYMEGKNALGQLASAAFILALYEIFRANGWKAFGVLIALVSFVLLVLSKSKTSTALAILIPFVAWLVLMARTTTRISPALLLFSIPVIYIVFAKLFGITVYRLSYFIYGDATFTSRTFVWEFAGSQIELRPLLGWGYQSFWLVGPSGPSVVHGPGWIKSMPNAHSGYLDSMLELGYVGFAFLLAFIAATLHAIGRVVDREPARGWILLSLALLMIVTNFLETTWMRGFELLWVVFLIVVAEAARYLQPVRSIEPSQPAASSEPVARPSLVRAQGLARFEKGRIEWAKRRASAAMRTSRPAARNNQLRRSRVG